MPNQSWVVEIVFEVGRANNGRKRTINPPVCVSLCAFIGSLTPIISLENLAEFVESLLSQVQLNSSSSLHIYGAPVWEHFQHNWPYRKHRSNALGNGSTHFLERSHKKIRDSTKSWEGRKPTTPTSHWLTRNAPDPWCYVGTAKAPSLLDWATAFFSLSGEKAAIVGTLQPHHLSQSNESLLVILWIMIL